MKNLTLFEKVGRNKSNYLKAKAAFNENEIEACITYYAANHKIHSNEGEGGREGIRKFLEGMHLTWPDIQIDVEHLVAEENWVMGRSVATATHTKSVLGVPPTNKKIKSIFWDLHYFDEEGLITETWNLIDNLSIMQQIGLFPDVVRIK